MRIARKLLALGAVLCALGVGYAEAASAAPPVPPKPTAKLPKLSVSPALANCNTATGFWWNYPYNYVVLPTVNGDPNCILGYGNQGNAVVYLQAALTWCHGQDTGGFDGIYGGRTRTAVRNVQNWAGIPADGVYGPQTRSVMYWPIFNAADGSFTGYCGRTG